MAIAPRLGVQWSEGTEAALKEVKPELPRLGQISGRPPAPEKAPRSATETKKAVRK